MGCASGTPAGAAWSRDAHFGHASGLAVATVDWSPDGKTLASSLRTVPCALVARGQSNATLKGHEGPAREPVNARRRRAGVGRRRRRCGLSATGEALTTPPIPDNRGGITCLT
ncbi:MAG: hypothetical protein U0232_16440 [Thermomicrobiales bacterium]